jgi:hypothetical protein
MDKKTYQNIKNYSLEAMKGSTDFQHTGKHLMRVERNAERIVGVLGLEGKVDMNLLGATCYLHDLAFTKHKPGIVNYLREGKRVKKLVTKLLKSYDIPDSEKRIIIYAVWKHTLSFPFRRLNKKGDNYAKILQDADILDMLTTERLLDLVKSAKKSYYYKTIKIFSKRVSRWTIRHIGLFLNFPELAEKFVI